MFAKYVFWSAKSIDFLYVHKYEATVFAKYSKNKILMSSGISGIPFIRYLIKGKNIHPIAKNTETIK